MISKIIERIKKGRTTLLLNHPFFGALIFRLKLMAALSIDTMATDGATLYFNPRFTEELPFDELLGVLAHEIMHCALNHHTRRGNREPGLWNEACDYAVNLIVIRAGLALPPGVLIDHRFARMSAEQIYNILLSEREESPQQNQSGNQQSDPQGQDGNDNSQQEPGKDGQINPKAPKTRGGFGQVLDAPNKEEPGKPLSEDQRSKIEADWRVEVHKAIFASAQRGKKPEGIERALEASLEAQVDWAERFKRSFADTIPANYSWSRPNRRFIGSGLYLPGIIREGVGEIGIAVDCSGSISDRQLGQFSEEANALIAEHRPSKVHVMYFDDVITRYVEYACGETISFEPNGGGGTEFEPIFTFINENGITPQALVVLTDLYGSFPDDEPGYPVIWVSTGRDEAPFGETISIKTA